MQKNFDEFSMQEALRLAQSDAGQQLLAMLQSQHKDEMNAAMASAGSGDYQQVKKTLASFLSDPKTHALLRQLQEERNG